MTDPEANGTVTARLGAQLLVGEPTPGPVEVAQHLLAIQAQDPVGARLAVRARTRGTVAADVDRALTEDRSLVVTWLNRGTLHLVAAEDLGWLHTLTTPRQAAANNRRLAQVGVPPADADRAVAAIVGALRDEGPLTRAQLRDRIDAIGVRTAGQALVHVLYRTAHDEQVVRGPVVDGDHAFVLARDWLEPTRPVDLERAPAELARRFLVGHGPATDRDLAKWAGVTLAVARDGLRAIADGLDDHDDRTVSLRRRAAPATEMPPPLLLGAFDPLLHGWVDRSPIIGDHRGIVTSNGVFRPFLLVDGRAAGLWRRDRGAVVQEPFAPLGAATQAALDAEAEDVRRFLAAP